MKGIVVWIRDKILPGVIILLLGWWFGSPTFKGFISTASDSVESLWDWMMAPVEIARWRLLFTLVVLLAYAAHYIFRRIKMYGDGRTEAAPVKGDEVVEPLPPHLVKILRYLGDRYERDNKHASLSEISKGCGVSTLLAEQALDQLRQDDLIKQKNHIGRQLYSLGSKGRDWLLANNQ